ncbi:MAG: PIN domain-containing protein [Candidatus Roizmanbacteria bacterium]|nr:PIN domain-containing protein [Candidatus Roizmanbacteria bacterium]
MKQLYFDTNIFIYFSNTDSTYYAETQLLLRYCQDNDIRIVTSCETIQEIIYYCQRIKQVQKGILMSNLVIQTVDKMFTVNQNTIELYLDLIQDFPTIPSRDLLHGATCILNGNLDMITYDKHLLKLGRISAQKPESFIKH